MVHGGMSESDRRAPARVTEPGTLTRVPAGLQAPGKGTSTHLSHEQACGSRRQCRFGSSVLRPAVRGAAPAGAGGARVHLTAPRPAGCGELVPPSPQACNSAGDTRWKHTITHNTRRQSGPTRGSGSNQAAGVVWKTGRSPGLGGPGGGRTPAESQRRRRERRGSPGGGAMALAAPGGLAATPATCRADPSWATTQWRWLSPNGPSHGGEMGPSAAAGLSSTRSPDLPPGAGPWRWSQVTGRLQSLRPPKPQAPRARLPGPWLRAPGPRAPGRR